MVGARPAAGSFVSLRPDATTGAPVDPVATIAGIRYRVATGQPIGSPWDDLVAGFADGCLEQTMAYMASRWDPSRLCGLVLRDAVSDDPLAAALAVVAVAPFLPWGVAYMKFGPVWRRRGEPPRPEVLLAALAAAREHFGHKRRLLVRVAPPPDPEFAVTWSAALAAAGYRRHASLEDPDRYFVDLALSEDSQLQSLGSSWRANLRKAASSQLTIHEADLHDGLPTFLALYHGMRARKQFADHHGIDTLPAFVAAASPALRLRLFFACREEVPLAGSLVAAAGERACVPLSASDDRARALRAGYALRWAIIERLRGSDVRWLDLGGAEGNAGLRSFKLGNVGKRGRVVTLLGEFDYAGSALSSTVAAMMTSSRRLSLAEAARRWFGHRR